MRHILATHSCSRLGRAVCIPEMPLLLIEIQGVLSVFAAPTLLSRRAEIVRVRFYIPWYVGRTLLRSPDSITPTHATQAFFDFRMRRSLAKVVKIRRDRASLPIAAYQDTIVRAVASNPCVLVAGDTGCGKSTQVCMSLLSRNCCSGLILPFYIPDIFSTGSQKVVGFGCLNGGCVMG